MSEVSETFDDWKDKRKQTVRTLRALADEIDVMMKKTGISKMVGHSAGIAAGALTVTGGILTVLTLGAASPVLFTGIGLGIAAGGTTAGSGITRSIVKSKKLKAAQEALDDDAEAKEKFGNQIMKYNLSAAVSSCKIAVTTSKKIVKITKLARLAKTAASAGSTVGKASVNVVDEAIIAGASGAGQIALNSGDEVASIGGTVATSAGKVSVGTVFALGFGVVAIGMDVWGLSKEIRNFAQSGDSAKLRELANDLEEELNELNSDYSD